MRGHETVLSLERVTCGYSATPVLREVSLRVGEAEVVGLVGPNGSGKTTLVRVASRALRPAAGAVRVAGIDPFAVPAREAARLIAVVPQELAPAFSFSVLEMVLMGRTPHLSVLGGGRPEDWSSVRAAMLATDVQHLAERPIDELSGGERRRVVLAQALAQGAPLLLLDEPTTHLDVRHVLDLLAIVRRLAEREGTAVLAIHHDLNVAAGTSDRLVALHGGRIVAEGLPEEVVTPDLLRSVYGVEADVSTDPTTGRPLVRIGVGVDAQAPIGRRAHVVPGAGRGTPLLRVLARMGYEVSVGVLHASDTDAAVAERLNLLRVSVPPFSPIDAQSAEACRALMRQADLVVVCDAPFGPGNVANLRLALAAARSGVSTVLLEQVPIEERDFTGGEASALWGELRATSTVARSYEEVALVLG
jgi:iron complex transport system ATP-binding protein